MYTSYFGFKENPFNLTPDPRYLFLSPHHKETLDHLLYGINEKKGFIVITGGIGTGKTTLCRVLLNHLHPRTKSALIFNSFISDIELLKTINQEFEILDSSNAVTKKDYIDALNHFLMDNFREGGNAILLIDEAQNLSHQALEQIRMLSNLETTREKLIQIILVGQPELKEILESPSIRQLNERVMVRHNLKTLDFRDIRSYVEHRIIIAGGQGIPRFTTGAFRQIYKYSGGNPRRINSVCDRALLIAYAKENPLISKDIIKTSVRELHGDDLKLSQGRNALERAFLYTALLLVLTLVAGFGGWLYRENAFSITEVNEEQFLNINKSAPAEISRPKEKSALLFLDERTSLSGLFTLFYERTGINIHAAGGHPLSLDGFELAPEYYVMLKKPFRVSMADSPATSKYLLIKKTSGDEAVVIDKDGKERNITRDFIIKHWGGEILCAYPSKLGSSILSKGMRGQEILKLQEMLQKIGYIVEPTGVYDPVTIEETKRFQAAFGLSADGIAGPRTRALLYQMVD